MSRIVLISLVLASLAACGDNDPTPADPPTPTANGVFPASGFVGRSLRVELTGDNTQWDAMTTASFGPSVTVVSTTLASPTVMFADIQIAGDAKPGLVTVAISDPTNDQQFALTDAFEIATPLSMEVTGTLAQGSIVKVVITNHDPDNLFDATADPGFIPPFTHLDVVVPDGVTSTITAATQSRIEATLTLDVNATAGELSVTSSDLGEHSGAIVVSTAGPLAVAARTAIPLTPGTLDIGHMDPDTSQLYSFTRGAPPTFTSLAVFGPNVIFLPDTGLFVDALPISFGPFEQFDDVAPIVSPLVYLVVVAHDFAEDDAQIAASTTVLTSVAETAGRNDTEAQSQPITLPAMFANASLSDENDVDVVSFVVAPGDIGKSIRVITDGDEDTDLVVDVFAKVGNDDVSLADPRDDGAGENFITAQIPDGATKVFVRFAASPNFDPDHSDYDAAVFLVP